ncbi:MAG: hypothetical protein M3550_12875 [Actinomycetota bacterium]|nr:hypothetical protein [Actinomycetota bacterium]
MVRGLVHGARIGQAGALDSARMLAGEIDNPALTALIAGDSQDLTRPRTRPAPMIGEPDPKGQS